MRAKNDEQEIEAVRSRIKAGKTGPEIAKELGWTRAKVAIISQRDCGGNPNYMAQRTKHKHLREDLLNAYLSMSAKECQDKFGMTPSEFKSCLTVAYRDPALAHIRKDTRKKDKWEVEEILTMLKYSGILGREEIAKLLNRGHARVIKERLSKLSVSSRNINGCNLTQFRKMFGHEPRYQIRGTAGPGEESGRNSFVIVPWFHVVELYSEMPHDRSLLKAFRCYAKFQAFVWRTDNVWQKMRRDSRIREYLVLSPKVSE